MRCCEERFRLCELEEGISISCLSDSDGHADNIVDISVIISPDLPSQAVDETVPFLSCTFDQMNTFSQGLSGPAKCSCPCVSLIEKVDGMTLEIEILKSRADSLQAFVNTQKIEFHEESHEKQIEQLERELREEKYKTEQLESDLVVLKRRFNELNNKTPNSLSFSVLYENAQDPVLMTEQPILVQKACCAEECSESLISDFSQGQVNTDSSLTIDALIIISDDENNNLTVRNNAFEAQVQEYQEKHKRLFEKSLKSHIAAFQTGTNQSTHSQKQKRKRNDYQIAIENECQQEFGVLRRDKLQKTARRVKPNLSDARVPKSRKGEEYKKSDKSRYTRCHGPPRSEHTISNFAPESNFRTRGPQFKLNTVNHQVLNRNNFPTATMKQRPPNWENYLKLVRQITRA